MSISRRFNPAAMIVAAALVIPGCVGGLPENAYRSTFGMDPAEKAYLRASAVKRRNHAKELKGFASEQAAWEKRARAQDAKRCKITLAEIAAARASFSRQPVQDIRGRISDFPLPTLDFDEQVIRDGNCIASYTLRRVAAHLDLPGIVLELTPPWEGVWQAGSKRPLPNVAFYSRVVGYEPVSKRIGIRTGDESLTILVDALSRDTQGRVVAQLNLHNQGERPLRLTALALHVHHAYGSLDVGAEPALHPSEESALLLEVQDLSLASPVQEVARLFGYGKTSTSMPVVLMVEWSYVVHGRDVHGEQKATVTLHPEP